MVLVKALALLIFGFIILVKGADFLVDGASALAKKFNISDKWRARFLFIMILARFFRRSSALFLIY